MNEPAIKARSRKRAHAVDSGTAAASATNGADALGEQGETLRDQLHEVGQLLLEAGKGLTGEVARQARLRPLAVFGGAFVAGVVVARALRR